MEKLVEQKVADKLDKIIKILNRKDKLNIEELVVLYGNLGYYIGASIGGYQYTGPSEEILTKLTTELKTEQSIDNLLMLQGLLITSWANDPNRLKLVKRSKE